MARLPHRSALPGHGARVAELVAALLAEGLDGVAVSAIVARLDDALTRRILRWAEADLGRPPAPYAWIAFGSEGRGEQTLLTDQDNLLAYADEGEPGRTWFRALSERANADLEAAGFAACPGGHMARNHHESLSTWVRRFDAAIDVPRPHQAELWFDFRRVGGRLDLSPLEAPLARVAREPLFLRFLAAEALAFAPPSRLALALGRPRTLDLKVRGLMPLVFLARCYALEAGSSARSTPARLAAARCAGLLDEASHAAALEALRFLTSLRLRVQLRCLDAGRPPANRAALAELAPAERTGLGHALGAVRAFRALAARHFGLEG